MGADEMRRIGNWMLQALRAPDDPALHQRIRGEVRDLCTQFPVPAAALKTAMNTNRGRSREGRKLMAESKILIADDNAANCELLEAYLADIDCEVGMAVDGQDTLDKVASFQPDLILLDIMMPKLNGFEVCKKIKEDARTRRIMILMVTALDERGDIERAVAAGTDDFLSKPVQKVELVKRVQNMLRLKDVEDENERLRRYIEEMEESYGCGGTLAEYYQAHRRGVTWLIMLAAADRSWWPACCWRGSSFIPRSGPLPRRTTRRRPRPSRYPPNSKRGSPS